MNKYKYKIIYDINRDIWNWYYGANYSNNGNQFTDINDKKMLKKVIGLQDLDHAKPVLYPFLQEKFLNKNSELNKFIKIIKSEFIQKFDDACNILERITNRPLSNDNFILYITTFPRMTVFFDEGIIFTYAKIDNKLWGMPIDGFLHEGLHFQFNKYWRENDKSPVSKLSEDEYFMIKESLTVILDDELEPIITLPDCSYPEFDEYRKVLHEHWQKYHDFEKLVKFGLKNLPKFIHQDAE